MSIGDYPPDPLESAQALSIIKHIRRRSRKGRRDRAIIAVMWRCGLRCGEVRDLEMSDVRRDPKSLLKVRWPKGRKQGAPPRDVGLDNTTFELIADWLEMRGREPGPLFLSGINTKLHTSNLRRVVASRAREAGIQRRVHPHCFRHTYARDLYLEGVGMAHIMNALGHTSLENTARYLGSIGCTEAVQVTSEREWRV